MIFVISSFFSFSPLFSCDAATLYEGVSVRPLVRRLDTLSFFGLLGATNAVYTAPLLVLLHENLEAVILDLLLL